MPGRPRGGHLAPGRTMVPSLLPGKPPVHSGVGDGPLLAGITVTVFPAGSSRSLTGSAAGLAGWATGSAVGTATAGAVAGAAMAFYSAASGRRARAGRDFTRDCRALSWARACCSSTGDAISTLPAGAGRVTSRSGREAIACSLSPGLQPRTAVIPTVSGSRNTVRMDPPIVQCPHSLR